MSPIDEWVHENITFPTEESPRSEEKRVSTAIPRWKYAIPSDLASQATLGPLSTWIGDGLGIVGAVDVLPFLASFFSTVLTFWASNVSNRWVRAWKDRFSLSPRIAKLYSVFNSTHNANTWQTTPQNLKLLHSLEFRPARLHDTNSRVKPTFAHGTRTLFWFTLWQKQRYRNDVRITFDSASPSFR